MYCSLVARVVAIEVHNAIFEILPLAKLIFLPNLESQVDLFHYFTAAMCIEPLTKWLKFLHVQCPAWMGSF